jgi:hypothetical protein
MPPWAAPNRVFDPRVFDPHASQELARTAPADPSKPKPLERLPRLASHLLQQRQFLPLLPVPADEKAPLAVDPIANLGSGLMTARPDILLLPSDLAPFAKEADGGVLAVNMGRLTRKQAGGSFASICIHPKQADDEGEQTGGISPVSSPPISSPAAKQDLMEVEPGVEEGDKNTEGKSGDGESGSDGTKEGKLATPTANEGAVGMASRCFVEVARI